VLGHEDCGAVAAALAGGAPEWLAPITEHIHFDETLAEEAASGAYELLSGEVHWLE